MADKMSGVAVGAIGAGLIFTYAGVKGYSIAATVKALISGTSPGGQAQTQGLTGVDIQTGNNSTVSGAGAGTGAAPSVAGDYTTADLVQLWESVGGSPGTSANAACHAMQESSGRASVTSSNPDGGTNVGLWQLDTKGVGSGYTVAQLQDPVTNATITVKATSNGNNWSDWSTPGC